MNTATAAARTRHPAPARWPLARAACGGDWHRFRPRKRCLYPLLTGLVVWSYWPTITGLREFWAANDDYSAGMLVPLVTLYLVWRERQQLGAAVVRPSAWGLGLVLVSQLMRFGGVYYAFASAERLSLIVLVSGLLLLVAGRAVFRRLIWVQAFLLLMVPLPQRIHYAVALPLQEWATSIAVFGLELLGYYVTREGNVLRMDERSAVMVAEACSGLRMLTAFVFTAAVLCFLVRRPVWQKAALVASSLPIAVFSNGLRVLITSVWVAAVRDVSVEQRLHDAAGLLMMPLAVLILLGEVKFLGRIWASPANRLRAAVKTARSAAEGLAARRPAARQRG